MTGNNRTTWLRDDGSTSSKPAASPDWRGEVAQNIRGSGFGSGPQAKAREAHAMRPSPHNFSGGSGMGAGFGPDDPRNTDHYWRAVAKAPGERAEAVRHNALAQEAAAKFPYGPQGGGHVPSLRTPTTRHPHMDSAFMQSFSERKAALKDNRAAHPNAPSPGGTNVAADLWDRVAGLSEWMTPEERHQALELFDPRKEGDRRRELAQSRQQHIDNIDRLNSQFRLPGGALGAQSKAWAYPALTGAEDPNQSAALGSPSGAEDESVFSRIQELLA